MQEEIAGIGSDEDSLDADREEDPSGRNNDNGWCGGPDQYKQMATVEPDSAIDQIAGAERCEGKFSCESLRHFKDFTGLQLPANRSYRTYTSYKTYLCFTTSSSK